MPGFGLLILAALCFLPSALHAQVPAFPGALGFGAAASGGRGGTVYHVTTLADSGAGSFRDAVSARNRIVVFDVGGYINLQSAVSVQSDITIAGQTAPGGGIGFRGGEISFANRSNIICRFIRIRPGDDTASDTDDALSFYRARMVICDHVSLEFAPWNNIDGVSDDWQNHPVDNITVQNSIIANPTGQQFGAHTEAVNGTWSWFYNVFANSHNRNPLAKVNTVFINNVLYNYQAGYTTHTSTKFKHDIVNNYFIMGPASGGTDNTWFQIDPNQSIYYSGNLKDTDKDGTLDGNITTPYWYNGTGTILTSPWSSWTTIVPIYSPAAAYRLAASQAGTLPHDPVDKLVIDQMKTLGNGATGTGVGTAGPDGGLYTSQTQTGLPNNGYGIINGDVAPLDTDQDGMPDYWEKAAGLNFIQNDAMILAPDGYANIEHYLNWLAAPHAVTITNTAVDVDLWQYTGGFTNVAPVYAINQISNGVVSMIDGHIARFTPATDSAGFGSFDFSVSGSDGTAYTNTVTIVISSISEPSNLIWQGDGVANLWAVDEGTNWLSGTNRVAFSAGDNVTFDDSGLNSPAINLSGPLVVGTVHVLAAQDYTFGGSGYLAGPGALIKTGSGRLNLNTMNTFSGGVLIGEGVVQLGDGVLVSGNLSGNVTNNETLIFANPTDVSSGASIRGSGTLIKRGAGTLSLSGTQTYTNLTTIENGTLEFTGTPPPGNITNNATLTFKPGSATTYAGTISGSGEVRTSGSGVTMTLSGENKFTGGLTVTAGNLMLAHSRAAGTGPVVNTSSGLVYVGDGVVITNDFTLTTATTDLGMRCDSGTGTWAGNITVQGGASWRPGSDGGTFVFTGTANQGTHNFIVPRGSVRFAENAVVSATGGATALGRDTSDGNRSANITIRDNAIMTLGACSMGGGRQGGSVTVTVQNNAALSTGANNFDLHNVNRSSAVTTIRLNGGSLTVGGFTKTRTYTSALNFNGGWLKAGANNNAFFPALTGHSSLVQADGAKIDDNGFAITIASPLLHDSALGSVVDGGLEKRGVGTLTLTGANTFTGPTLIGAGKLALSGGGSIAASSDLYLEAGATFDVTAAGGGFSLNFGKTISGNGSINGGFSLNSGAILRPGNNSIGRLTFNGSLTLGANSTQHFDIQKTGLTNDSVFVSGALVLNGTLTVTNLAGALAAGDVFQLFSAGTFSGSFSTVNLPPLDAGLAWNTNQLSTAGKISVVRVEPIQFSSVAMQAGELMLNGSGGAPNGVYYLLMTTNLSLPIESWLRVETNFFDANGQFSRALPLNSEAAGAFFKIQIP
ncbi:MAG TPA: autotransporter-associated beta strand repeat-containing protein [Verrucomicrobiae bacterium]|nr:autotransporter-associated beta strand repeat-containing protein [Verrucomicrobiae bacterium]